MQQVAEIAVPRPWIQEKLLMGLSLREYIRSLITPFNAAVGCILVVGLPVIAYRFLYGLGAATNLSQTNPWGLWIGFDVLCGVALAAGGFTLATTVYLFGIKDYYPVLRPAVLTGFLGYFFVVVGLLVDLGRPYRIVYPVFYSFGVTSVMFEVAWCVFLYLTVLSIEFSPALFEWLGWKIPRKWVVKMTIGLTVLGTILSMLHQSSLGALFLIAPTKLHPLYYTPFIPVYFFVTAVAAGLTMVIVESTLSESIFHDQIHPERPVDVERITLGLGRAAAVVLYTLFFMKLLSLADNFHFLGSPMGTWYLTELFGFTVLPCFIFAFAVRAGNINWVRVGAVLTVIGVVLSRLDVSIIAFNWNVPDRYFPSNMEFMTTLTIVTLGIMTFRFIVNRMPILYEHPEYGSAH